MRLLSRALLRFFPVPPGFFRVLFSAAALVFVLSVSAAVQVQTPILTSLTPLPDPVDPYAYASSAQLSPEETVGFGVVCDRDTRTTSVAVYLGGFPADLRPVQLSVRAADGSVHRFGPVLSHSGPASGYFTPQIVDPGELARFSRVAFVAGALVSSGYNSFWNRLGPADNALLAGLDAACRSR